MDDEELKKMFVRLVTSWFWIHRTVPGSGYRPVFSKHNCVPLEFSIGYYLLVIVANGFTKENA